MNKKKEIIRTIRNFKRILKSGNVKTVLTVSDWDIYAKTYTIEEIAARFLRIKGYNVQITISDNTEHLLAVWGIERSGFFNGREKWVKGFENQMV